jgi:hypothetical protein
MSSEAEGGGAAMFSVNSIAGGSHAPAEVKRLAERLGKAHDCPIQITSEANGYHIYLPCPECLETHGKSEINEPKYAINASKYLGLGEFRRDTAISAYIYEEDSEAKEANTSVCMRTYRSKTPHRFRVKDLLQMGSVLSRHPELLKVKFKLVGTGASDDARSHWVPDSHSGIMCPPPPGTVIPLSQLGDPFHPAIEYLAHRNFDIAKLESQFHCGFCTAEAKHGENGIFWRQLVGGWRDTTQHRIVFHAIVDGAPMTWQARLIEKVSDDGLQRLMLHPYKIPFQWDVVAVRSNAGANWIWVPPFNEMTDGALKFNPSKYRTAKYSTREMMGWDAAVRRAEQDPNPLKWVVLCEGPLDAARVGPGGVALIGSSLTPGNLQRVAATFHIVYTAFDTDKVGTQATEKIGKMLYGADIRNKVTQLVRPLRITGGKDIGDMTQLEFDRMFKAAQDDVSRQF